MSDSIKSYHIPTLMRKSRLISALITVGVLTILFFVRTDQAFAATASWAITTCPNVVFNCNMRPTITDSSGLPALFSYGIVITTSSGTFGGGDWNVGTSSNVTPSPLQERYIGTDTFPNNGYILYIICADVPSSCSISGTFPNALVYDGPIVQILWTGPVSPPSLGSPSTLIPPQDLTQTRFVPPLVPSPGSTVASGTPTTVGAEIYVNPDDYASGAYLSMRFVNNTLQNGIGGSALDAWNAAFGEIRVPISAAGSQSLSTTTLFSDPFGQINAQYRIIVPRSSFFGLITSDEILAATSSSFVVGTPTALDVAMASSSPGALISALVTGTTTVNLLEKCKIAGFDLVGCLLGIVVPDQATIQDDLSKLRAIPPWGYGFRFYDIVRSATTTPLPSLSIVDPITGSTLNLTPWDGLMGSSSIISQATSSFVFGGTTYGTGQTLRQVAEPYWNFAWYLLLAIAIVRDIVGVARGVRNGFGSRGSLSDTNAGDDSYRLKETLYNMSQRK